MKFEDLIKLKDFAISFESIFEPRIESSSLRIIVNGSADTTDLLITPHSLITQYQINFPSYVTYSVIYDDYTIFNEKEIFKGESFRIYSKSDYFDFIQRQSPLEKLLPGETCIHYALCCIEHRLDIISSAKPFITEIKVNPEKENILM
ncbi:hypothetical protein ACFPYN_13070 [Paenisporosarcina macmurdoensis]|uniref:Uncharacterized protein n=1 Tax=Paenisporosarcina macmurdoensis TaxID=212659 RepID=A0ABW1L9I2_9BACL